MKLQISVFCILLCLLGPFSGQAPAAEGPPVASLPPDLVLGDFSGFPLDYSNNSMAFDPASGKLFVTGARSSVIGARKILRFSSQGQMIHGGLPEAEFLAGGVSDLAVDSKGCLWAAQGHRIVRFDNAVFRAEGGVPDGVLGQPDLTTNTAAAGQAGLNYVSSLAVDPAGTLWVADQGNHRVLGFKMAAAKPNGAPADLLLGQPNWTNTGSGISMTRMTSPGGLAADSAGRLWVVDFEQRALRFDNASAKELGAPADGRLGLSEEPYGQFVSRGVATDPHNRLYIYSARTTGIPRGSILRWDEPWTKPPDVVPDGYFSVSNQENSVLGPNSLNEGSGDSLWIFAPGDFSFTIYRNRPVAARVDAPSTAAGLVLPDGVLGSSDLSSASPRLLANPRAVIEDPVSRKVFVADTNNNRVLRYPSVSFLNSGALPEAVFGQPDFTTITIGVASDKLNRPYGCALDSNGNLWVSDTGNHRVLRFANAVNSPTGTPAVAVLGQSDFTTAAMKVHSEYSLTFPGSIVTGPGGELWVSEIKPDFYALSNVNARVIRYDNAAAAVSGAPASGVLGRVDFYDNQWPAASSSTAFTSVESLFCDPEGRLWVMSVSGRPSNNLYDLYRFDAATAKLDGAPADSSMRLNVFATAMFAPVGPGERSRANYSYRPSFYIDVNGRLMLLVNMGTAEIWNTYFVDAFLFNIPNAMGLPSLPAIIDQPALADSVLMLPSRPAELLPYGQDATNTVGISPSGKGHVWISDGASSVQRYSVPPYSTENSGTQIVYERGGGSGQEDVVLRFASFPGRDYQLLRSLDLGEWMPVRKISAAGTFTTVREAAAPGSAYFKVVLLP